VVAFRAAAAYDAAHMRRRRRAKRWSGVEEVLGKVMHRVAPPQDIAGYAAWSFWDDVVGETIAMNAQPTHFRNGTLLVGVKSHTWVQELQFLKSGIRTKLNVRLGGPVIRDIQAHVGEFERLAPATIRSTRLPDGPTHIEVPGVANDDIQEALARIVAARARRLQTQRDR